MKSFARDIMLILCTVLMTLNVLWICGVFEYQLSESQQATLANSVARKKDFKDDVVSEMQGRGIFVGPIGQQGPRGPKGDSVPVGTVLPFIGQVSQLPPGWRVANEEVLTAFFMNHNENTEANTMAAQVASKLRSLAGC